MLTFSITIILSAFDVLHNVIPISIGLPYMLSMHSVVYFTCSWFRCQLYVYEEQCRASDVFTDIIKKNNMLNLGRYYS